MPGNWVTNQKGNLFNQIIYIRDKIRLLRSRIMKKDATEAKYFFKVAFDQKRVLINLVK